MSITDTFIGIDKDGRSDGFIGNLRNFKFFKTYYDDATLWRT